MDDAEKLLDVIRTNELAHAAFDPALDPSSDQRGAKQPVWRALIRALRDPSQLPILRAELGGQDYAGLLGGLRGLGAMPDDIDAKTWLGDENLGCSALDWLYSRAGYFLGVRANAAGLEARRRD